jgi:hypothetical protein
MGELARATLTPLDINSGSRGTPIDVCFNPKEYSLEKTVNWKPQDSKGDAQIVQYDTPSPMTLSVTLQFDTYEERVSVRDKYVRKIEALTLVGHQTVHGFFGGDSEEAGTTPPMVLFTWGNFKFKGVVDSLSQKYTMFLQDGTPVRAEVSLKIRNALDKQESPGNVKQDEQEVVVPQGMRPDQVAAATYGDPTKWPQLMSDNGVDDPLSFSGTVKVKNK